jgi:protein-S-isoprenylcysteine O-methyltransferase Ste14
VNPLHLRALRSSLLGAVLMAALLFIPAGTLDYWQAWAFMAVFAGSSTAVTVYLARHDPALLERRMTVGPTAEKEPTQQIVMLFAMAGFVALVLVPAFDRRFGWSRVPAWASVAGDALVALGFYFTFLVLKANPYSASTIQIAEGQTVISTGPYAIVRHPMYAGATPLVVAMPVALGSWWGLLAVLVMFPALVWRMLDEERFLEKNLKGYTEYTQKVRYRLLPHLW